MSGSSPTTTLIDPLERTGGHLLIGRIRLLSGLAVSAAIFWYVGPWALGPIDPRGPITLLAVPQGVIAMAELLGLAIVTSGLAVAISGAGASHRGPLAVAVGLAALGLHGSQMDELVLYRLHGGAAAQATGDAFPTWGLIAETWLWLALIGVGWVVGRWVDSWFEVTNVSSRPGILGASDMRQSTAAIALAALVAWVVISYASGREESALLRGQIYFSVAAGFVIAALAAHSCFNLDDNLWALASVGVVAMAAYILAAPTGKDIALAREHGTYLVLSPMARPLPIEYAALGAAGAFLEKDAMTLLRSLFGLQKS
jgi:hypothetical protein